MSEDPERASRTQGVSPHNLSRGDQLMAEAETVVIQPMMAAAREFLEEVDPTVAIAIGTRHLIDAGYPPLAALTINMLIVRYTQALLELEDLRSRLT